MDDEHDDFPGDYDDHEAATAVGWGLLAIVSAVPAAVILFAVLFGG